MIDDRQEGKDVRLASSLDPTLERHPSFRPP
jgi:hypothetical protein